MSRRGNFRLYFFLNSNQQVPQHLRKIYQITDWPTDREMVEIRLTMVQHREKFPRAMSGTTTGAISLVARRRSLICDCRLWVVRKSRDLPWTSLADDDGSTHRPESSPRRFKYYVTRERECESKNTSPLFRADRSNWSEGGPSAHYSTRIHLRVVIT